ncbi:MAG: Dabb family protein [Burkholderiales bacterium]|nr:Dabb family protein [Burkholderiales bacterium]MDE2395430.1 Dabb family protein [Burkholderiales bacterium]MDE2455466.1 Dabb family protein [Burkholderiales bacterium]
MIKHLVLLRFTDAADAARRAAIAVDFASLRERIALVRDLEWGPNASPEGLDKGFTHVFVLGFANAADRDAYLPHPEHLAFVERLKPWLADVLVVDYACST